ncbi:MAG TPA: CoB--CoM heterodisulfide reductase subunit C, partial [Methanospirillum sp.]|nr:CoB--CoM heterodisulfide reductase subunit C [Methanospirillum sp.]
MAAKTYNIPELDKKLADRRYHLSDTNPEFTKNILKTSRTIANMCYQCGTCTGSCPSAPR